MKIIQAEDIRRFDHWTTLIYSEPGKGKTSMVLSLTGRTIVFSSDGMYHVLENQKDVTVLEMDPKKPIEELGDFYRYLVKNRDNIDNIVFDMTVSDRQVAVFQDSADKALSMEFDSLQESAQFDADELADALIEIASNLKGATA